MNMKRFEKFAILLLVLWLLQRPVGHLVATIYFWTSFDQIGHLISWQIFSGYALTLFKQMANILIGVWLFITVKKEKQGTPWFWLMLGCFTGIIAPLLYFVLRIYQSVKPKNELPVETLAHSDGFIKKIEIAALIILPFWLLHLFFGPTLQWIYYFLFSLDNFRELKQATSDNLWMSYSYSITKQAFYILIGIWLFITAKKEKQGTPWLWLVLGIFGGVFAALFYFTLRIYQTIKPENMIVK